MILRWAAQYGPPTDWRQYGTDRSTTTSVAASDGRAMSTDRASAWRATNVQDPPYKLQHEGSTDPTRAREGGEA